MIDKNRIVKAVFSSVERYNEGATGEELLEKSLDVPLLGQSGVLDSLAFVRFIVTVEMSMFDEYGVSVVLADERAFSQRNSPFLSMKSLVDYIAALLEKTNA